MCRYHSISEHLVILDIGMLTRRPSYVALLYDVALYDVERPRHRAKNSHTRLQNLTLTL